MEPTRPVVVLAYDGTAADEAGAVVEILTAAGVPVTIASVEAHPVTSYHGKVVPQRAAGDLGRSHALVVPGGMGVRRAAEDDALLDAIRHLDRSADWLCATSTGSVLLAAAGLADHARVTTHWLAGDLVTDRGADLVDRSFVEHGRLLTAGGLASTATLSFRLVRAILGDEAERVAKARYQPRRPVDRRYGRGRRERRRPRFEKRTTPWWSRDRWVPGRRRIESVSTYDLDPTGAADLVILDLDDPTGDES